MSKKRKDPSQMTDQELLQAAKEHRSAAGTAKGTKWLGLVMGIGYILIYAAFSSPNSNHIIFVGSLVGVTALVAWSAIGQWRNNRQANYLQNLHYRRKQARRATQ